MQIRALLNSKLTSILIGNGGGNIRRMRQASGAHMEFTPLVHGVNDRVLSVTGTADVLEAGIHEICKILSGSNENVVLEFSYLVWAVEARKLEAKLRKMTVSHPALCNVVLVSSIQRPLPLSTECILKVTSIAYAAPTIARFVAERITEYCPLPLEYIHYNPHLRRMITR